LFTSLIAIAMALVVAQVLEPKRWRSPVVGVLVGFAVLTKWFPAFLVFGLWGYWLLRRGELMRRKGELLIAIAFTAATVLPWEAFAINRYPVEHALYLENNWNHVVQVLDEHVGTPFFHIARVPRTYGEASVIACLWFIWALAIRGRDAVAQMLTLWLAVPYLFFAFARTKMENHVLFAAPAVCLMVAWAIGALTEALRSPLQRWWRVMLTALLASWVLLPARFTIERWKPFQLDPQERALARALRALPAEIDGAPQVYFGASCHCAPAAMFYAGVTAYPGDADASQRTSVLAAGSQPAALPAGPSR
jgi:4-amino-4-deoxy-L-arabinose transferase-like glycosyltransferase